MNGFGGTKTMAKVKPDKSFLDKGVERENIKPVKQEQKMGLKVSLKTSISLIKPSFVYYRMNKVKKLRSSLRAQSWST